MTTAKVLLAWLLVGLPLAWGLTDSVKKALPLFQESTHSPAVLPKPQH
ncbi:MAG: hypothetical protein IT576_03800 [Verrucomicrobiales bacterium]|nr:hypothetical protein [Verrucomicrobiales bacterium]